MTTALDTRRCSCVLIDPVPHGIVLLLLPCSPVDIAAERAFASHIVHDLAALIVDGQRRSAVFQPFLTGG